MATKSPSTGVSQTTPLLRFLSLTDVTLPLSGSSTSSTALSQMNSILGFLSARSCMILEARRASRRWTTCTCRPSRERYRASSMAESPPPTTMMFWSLKKKPSQVAQVETPRPMSLDSLASPISLAEAPVAMITVSASTVVSPAVTRKGRRPDRKSTRLNSSHVAISYAVFCLKKKKKKKKTRNETKDKQENKRSEHTTIN